MHRRSIVLLAFGLGMIAIPIVTVVISPAIAQEDELVRVAPTNDDDPKQIYLDLIKSKLSLMTPEELQRETDELRGELFEMQATEKLRDAERKRQEVIEQHPQTTAAQRARNMLKNSERGRSDSHRDDDFQPSVPPRNPPRQVPSNESETVRSRRRPAERDPFSSPADSVPIPEDDAR